MSSRYARKPRKQKNRPCISSDNVIDVPHCGVNAFDRLIPAQTTLVEEEDGKFIIPPGGNFAVFLTGGESGVLQARIAFRWWEERC